MNMITLDQNGKLGSKTVSDDTEGIIMREPYPSNAKVLVDHSVAEELENLGYSYHVPTCASCGNPIPYENPKMGNDPYYHSYCRGVPSPGI